MQGYTIAIDGFSSCGKSTLAREIAKALNYVYVDSGAMYRAATLYFIRKGIITSEHFDIDMAKRGLTDIHIRFHYNKALETSETYLNDENVEAEIRSSQVSSMVSAVSAVPEVRTKMVAIQKEMGNEGAVVMDGRDIGTVVFPNADVKLFMTASNEIRAKRRLLELQAKGENVTLEDVKKALEQRDHLDMNRDVSPLKKADDAIVIDNSELDREQQLELALSIISKKVNHNLPAS